MRTTSIDRCAVMSALLALGALGAGSLGCGRKFVGTSPDATAAPDGAGNSTADAAPWCQQTANTVYVHGILGNDASQGTCVAPVKSVTKGVAIVSANGSLDKLVIAGRAGSPIVYGANETGETFPIILTKNLSVIGSGSDQLTIRGGGSVPGQANSFAIVVHSQASFSALGVEGSQRGILLVNDLGRDPAVGTFDRIKVASTAKAGNGIEVLAGTSAIITQSLFSNAVNAISGNSQAISLTKSEMRDSYNGVFIYNEGIIDSRENRYINNTSRGINLAGNGRANSTLDVFDGNKAGLGMADSANSGTGATVTGSQFINQTGNGVELGFYYDVKIRGCTFNGNDNAIFIDTTAYGTSKLDLGTASEPGGNTLQSTTNGNAGAGVCNKSTNTIVAARNTFKTCPPAASATCTGSVDTVGAVTASCP
jgi:hypothetical protein